MVIISWLFVLWVAEILPKNLTWAKMGIYWLTCASHKIRFRSSVQLSWKVFCFYLHLCLPLLLSLSLFLAHLLLLSLLMAWQLPGTFIFGLSSLPWPSVHFFFPPSFTLKKAQEVLWQGWFESHAHLDCGPCEHGVCGVLGWGRPGSRIPAWERREAVWHCPHHRIWVRGRLPQRSRGRWEGAVWSKGKKKDPGWVNNRCPLEGLWFEIQAKFASLIAKDFSSGDSGFESSSNHHTLFVQSLSCVWSLWPHGLQHARLPSPSLCPRVCSNSCPLNWWCHPTILSSVIPFSFCLQYVPASGSFPVSWLFASGGKSIGASASVLVLPVNIQNWFPLGLTGFISLLCKGLSRVFSSTTVRRHQFFGSQSSLWSKFHIRT